MKTIATQVALYLREPGARTNIKLLAKIVLFAAVVVVVHTLIFHLLMWREGQSHSFLSGFYWTVVTMSTLGFGDIAFLGDLGRMYSVVVILTGIMLLLVVLPFAFIQFFYAPWLEAQMRLRAPREVPPGTAGHVIITEYEIVAASLTKRLSRREDDYYVIVPDAQRAAELHLEGIRVVTGDADDVDFLKGLRVDAARLVFVSGEDEVNTNVTLTVREVTSDVPVAAIVTRESSHDVLQLSGVTIVLPLKRWLGEQLANRVAAVHARSHVVGHYRDLLLAELPVRNTPLAGKTVRATRLRESTGISVVGVWERGVMHTARPDTLLTDSSVAVVVGNQEQLESLDEMLLIYNYNPNPIVVIGAGRVGRAAASSLTAKDLSVHIIERRPEMAERMRGAMPVFEGDAADYELLMRAGIHEAPAVVLTTHDDATNIYLASYCRRLNPELRIVSRMTHERNIEAVHRAGADFALSYSALGVAAVLAELDQRELSVLGGELDIVSATLPRKLIGKTLAESGIGARTGLLVLAIQEEKQVITNPPANTTLHADAELVMIGDQAQVRDFDRLFSRE
jgi:voltage-gated potassium channel